MHKQRKHANLKKVTKDAIDNKFSNFAHADMSNMMLPFDFSNANFYNAHLHGSWFHEANFNNADLTNANMGDTNLEYTNLTNAKMNGVIFYNTIVDLRNLATAKLELADLTGVRILNDKRKF